MTALNRLQRHPLTEIPPASRKDLLGVGQNRGLAPMTINTARKWLANLGFEVRLVKPEHWIITHGKALPEFHFYSAVELSQFAAHRAHRYADTFTREES
ncbi:hypothetical protein QPM17_04490 [Marinobacter sp. TBZ242]|uniref:Uncharacterized protein n=1 Tax=Marinobacter azerbaijanicus TaxID=3050455 RepID=A0ABT7IAZ5_9GAMM|nr:hypothetical protein [Marinobacter sp. TBZ242]MDL0430368.1 hypothetical protein [Marinobacter sp. TBZ242]